SDTSRYCVDVMATQKIFNSWVWKHVLKLDNFTIQCNINNCDKIFKTIGDENTTTCSHHDNINRQASGNRENEQR
ncbi:hypothetical protein ALC56_09375, partial [Trachymyrmex septentrionalis]